MSLQTKISNLMKLAETSPNGKGEIARYEQFSISNSVLQTRKNQGLFGKRLSQSDISMGECNTILSAYTLYTM